MWVGPTEKAPLLDLRSVKLLGKTNLGVGELVYNQLITHTQTMLGGSFKRFSVQYLLLHQKAGGPETLSLRALLGLHPRFPGSQTRSVLTQNLKKERVYLNLGQ